MENNQNNDFSDSIGRIVSAGHLAKLRLYQEYITRISNGEKLTLSEKKHFDDLDQEFNDLTIGGRAPKSLSADQVVERLGISDQQRKWHTTRGNLKRNKDGTYPISSIEAFEKKYKRKSGGPGKGSKLVDESERVELRYRIARARFQELNVQQLRGELMPRDEVYREWGKRLNTLFSGIRLWTNRLCPVLEGKTRDEMQRIFDEEIYILMKTFSEKGRYCPEIDGAVTLDDA